MRIARTCALLVVLCLVITSVASASSYGPEASKGNRTNSTLSKPNVASNYPYYGWLYLNPYTGATSANVDAWTINYGYAVSNSFELGGNSQLWTGGIISWQFPYYFSGAGNMYDVGWQIGTCPFCNNVSSGYSPIFAQVNFGYNGYGYSIAADYWSFGGVNVGPGTYYLTLDNAYGGSSYYGGAYPVYWDQNAGPFGGAHSTAFENYVGWLGGVCGTYFPGYKGGTCSETFGVSGYGSGQAPEPGSLMLLGSGLLGLGGVIRRRFAK